MDRFSTLSLVLSLAALVAFSWPGVEVARADVDTPQPVGVDASHAEPGSGASCQPGGKGAHGSAGEFAGRRTGLEQLGERLAASPIEEDFLPLNNQGYHYQATQTPSTEMLRLDGELQHPTPKP